MTRLKWSSRKKKRRSTTHWRALTLDNGRDAPRTYDAVRVTGGKWMGTITTKGPFPTTRRLFGPYDNSRACRCALETIHQLEVQ